MSMTDILIDEKHLIGFVDDLYNRCDEHDRQKKNLMDMAVILTETIVESHIKFIDFMSYKNYVKAVKEYNQTK